MKRFVEVKLNKTFYNEYEVDAIFKKLRYYGFFIEVSLEQFQSNVESSSLNREFTLRW